MSNDILFIFSRLHGLRPSLDEGKIVEQYEIVHLTSRKN